MCRSAVETHDVAALAVQGPTSYSVLTPPAFDGLDDLKPFGIKDLQCNGFPVTVSRTGYTGDLGYELWTDPDNALALWDAIFAVQGQYDIHPIGLDTLEMVRIEAGFIMPGFDFNCAEATIRNGYDRSPYEVGLGWVVNLDKGHFTGRKALAGRKGTAAKRRLTKLVVDGNKPVGEAFIYAGKNGKQVGEVKCTTWSPILKANLAIADIDFINGRLPENLWAQVRLQTRTQVEHGVGQVPCANETVLLARAQIGDAPCPLLRHISAWLTKRNTTKTWSRCSSSSGARATWHRADPGMSPNSSRVQSRKASSYSTLAVGLVALPWIWCAVTAHRSLALISRRR